MVEPFDVYNKDEYDGVVVCFKAAVEAAKASHREALLLVTLPSLQ